MVKFACHNAKNANISYTPFELNCGFHYKVLYKKIVNFHSKSKIANQLATKLQILISIYKKNLQLAQDLHKQYYDKHKKLKNYVSGDKVWFNKKYIKNKQI